MGTVQRDAIREQLEMGDIFFEKCTLQMSEVAFQKALKLAEASDDVHAMLEALIGLVRLANESLDEKAIVSFEARVDAIAARDPARIPAMVWYCKGAITRHYKNLDVARRQFFRYLRDSRTEEIPADSARRLSREDAIARGWAMIAIVSYQKGTKATLKRARWISERLVREFEGRDLRRINGNVQLLLAKLAERRQDLDEALKLFQKAHGWFLSEHNWYYHLHVIYGYARIARVQRNFPLAHWYLDLLDKATSGPGFAVLQNEVKAERTRLEHDAVDLLIDSQKGSIKTRETGSVSLRKQYILLHILEALWESHERGLTKAEIIEKVWGENYRPESHDNKLYYNINRLRKLIEPDMKQPQYLLNSREGYRLAPGLRIHRVAATAPKKSRSLS